jgi:NCS1 family nucleobase:cation symporter-1
LLGPIAGIMIADYFLLRGCELDLKDLYRAEGKYFYTRGVNWIAIIALVAGIAVALVGLIVPSLRWLYDYAWFVGFFTAGAVYLSLMKKEQ